MRSAGVLKPLDSERTPSQVVRYTAQTNSLRNPLKQRGLMEKHPDHSYTLTERGITAARQFEDEATQKVESDGSILVQA
jgi:hypothetical protein